MQSEWQYWLFFSWCVTALSGMECFVGIHVVSWREKGGPAAFTLIRWPLFLHVLLSNIALSSQSINKYLLSAYDECPVVCWVLWRSFFFLFFFLRRGRRNKQWQAFVKFKSMLSWSRYALGFSKDEFLVGWNSRVFLPRLGSRIGLFIRVAYYLILKISSNLVFYI